MSKVGTTTTMHPQFELLNTKLQKCAAVGDENREKRGLLRLKQAVKEFATTDC